MIIESMRPVLAVSAGFIAALLILFFGNKVRPNVREAITIIASIVMASLVFSISSKTFLLSFVSSGKIKCLTITPCFIFLKRMNVRIKPKSREFYILAFKRLDT